ncbi:MAG: GIY-YIG nuclease family protein [Elusimicrobiota bacterium]
MEKRYLRMLETMRSEGPKNWSVYIARCVDGTYYTGIAKDVSARLAAHNSGKGAAYTRTRRPVGLAHAEPGMTRSEALVREAQIKRLARERKTELIDGTNSAPDERPLSRRAAALAAACVRPRLSPKPGPPPSRRRK